MATARTTKKTDAKKSGSKKTSAKKATGKKASAKATPQPAEETAQAAEEAGADAADGVAEAAEKPNGKAKGNGEVKTNGETDSDDAEVVQLSEAESGKKKKKKKDKDKKKRKVSFESVMLRKEAVSYLEAVVDGLKQGEVKFAQGEEALVLTLADSVAVEVTAAMKGNKRKIELELSWREPEPVEA